MAQKQPAEAAVGQDGQERDGGLVGGKNAVLAALKARPRALRRLYLAEGRHGGGPLDEIAGLARAAGVGIKVMPRKFLDRQYGRTEHQGVLAVFDALDYTPFEDFLAGLPPAGPALTLVLDGVADPRNLGALMRTAAAFGARGLVVPRERAAALTPAALAAAAGAAEYVPLSRVVNVRAALLALKENNFWVVGAEGRAETGLPAFAFPERTALVLGSEGRGISPLVYKTCDFTVRIPQQTGRVSSLNVSSSGAVLMFEYTRQHGSNG